MFAAINGLRGVGWEAGVRVLALAGAFLESPQKEGVNGVRGNAT